MAKRGAAVGVSVAGLRSHTVRCGKIEPAAVMTFDHGADVRQVRLGPARMDDHVPGQVVGRLALPAIDHLAGREVDGVEDAGVELGDVERFLVRSQGDAADHGAGRDFAQHLALLQIDLADRAGILVRDIGPAAVAQGDDAVGFVGHVQLLDDLARRGVDEDDEVVAVNGDGGQGPLPIQVTPSGLSPTGISWSFFLPATSTTVTVPLSALATSRRVPSGETSMRLLEDPARAAQLARTTAMREAATRADMLSTPEGGRKIQCCHYGEGQR